jgi:uncharacterized protein YndB with AHSA1/START domain
MGIKTDASIEIDAPPETVFDWLTERDKLAKWTGVAPDYMPADVSELTAGFHGKGTLKAPDGPRKAQFDVTDYEPPAKFGFKVTYEGGDSITDYRLTPTGSGTKLEIDADTDYARMGELPEQAEQQIENQPAWVKAMIHHQMHAMQHMMESGAMDSNPMVKKGMEDATEQMLGKLKKLIESG